MTDVHIWSNLPPTGLMVGWEGLQLVLTCGRRVRWAPPVPMGSLSGQAVCSAVEGGREDCPHMEGGPRVDPVKAVPGPSVPWVILVKGVALMCFSFTESLGIQVLKPIDLNGKCS